MSDDKIETALDVLFTLPQDEIERLRQGAQWPNLFAVACRQLASITPIELAEFYAAPGNEVGCCRHSGGCWVPRAAAEPESDANGSASIREVYARAATSVPERRRYADLTGIPISC